MSGPEKRQFGLFTMGFAGVIACWAFLHDWWLITVEPRHFTEFHPPLLSISHPVLLALQYAVVASLGPGLAYGMMVYFAARRGRWKKLALRPLLLVFCPVLLAVEAVVTGMGLWAVGRFDGGLAPLYPEWLYPELSRGLVYTQTVNISTYAVAPLSGLLYLWFIIRRRKQTQGIT